MPLPSPPAAYTTPRPYRTLRAYQPPPPPEDIISITDLLQVTVVGQRILADSIGVTDAATASFLLTRLVDDSVGLVDLTSEVGQYVREVYESVSLTDQRTIAQGFTRILTESVGVTDSLVTALQRILTDSVGLTDLADRTSNYLRLLIHAVGLTDAQGQVYDAYRPLADTLGMTDTWSITLGKMVADSLGITEDMERAFLRSIFSQILVDGSEGFAQDLRHGWGDLWHAWVTLELDTTKPTLTVDCPTSVRAPEDIIEVTGTFTGTWGWGEVRIRDAFGKVWPIGLHREDQTFRALISTYDLSKGLAKVTVTVADDVGNTTEQTVEVSIYREETSYTLLLGVLPAYSVRLERSLPGGASPMNEQRVYTVGETPTIRAQVADPRTNKPLNATSVKVSSFVRDDGLAVALADTDFTHVGEGIYELAIPTDHLDSGTYAMRVTVLGPLGSVSQNDTLVLVDP